MILPMNFQGSNHENNGVRENNIQFQADLNSMITKKQMV